MIVTHSFGRLTTAGIFFSLFMLCWCSAHKVSICSVVGFNGSRVLCFSVQGTVTIYVNVFFFFFVTPSLLVSCDVFRPQFHFVVSQIIVQFNFKKCSSIQALHKWCKTHY